MYTFTFSETKRKITWAVKYAVIIAFYLKKKYFRYPFPQKDKLYLPHVWSICSKDHLIWFHLNSLIRPDPSSSGNELPWTHSITCSRDSRLAQANLTGERLQRIRPVNVIVVYWCCFFEHLTRTVHLTCAWFPLLASIAPWLEKRFHFMNRKLQNDALIQMQTESNIKPKLTSSASSLDRGIGHIVVISVERSI